MEISVRQLGHVAYLPTYAAMQEFTAVRRQSQTGEIADQLWICEHDPVFTLGLAGRTEHIFSPGDIAVVNTDRGGQVTYHGPGQVVAYPLLDLQRTGYFVKELVYRIEEAIVQTLSYFGVTGHRVPGAPGIYVRLADPRSHARLHAAAATNITSGTRAASGTLDGRWPKASPDFRGLGKIGALGIKVSHHCAYHGLALNVAMDLEPFSRINPCGYPGLQVVDLRTIGVDTPWDDAANVLGQKLSLYLAP
jgi:lipoyl(octanoyl) transferase